MNVVIGTAGHIDHGKTALVKALTGIDADRLPEEKKRGITIDIGFAELDLGDVHASFVDVPGHERFVKNMLAGASGIDIVMLVVAADEGVMPQTREHFNICRLLGLKSGLVVITKADLADDETLDLVKLDIADLVEGFFLEAATVVVTSASDARGFEELKQAIRESAFVIRRAETLQNAFLPIDRSFSVKGYGAVVTGTLQSGEIGLGSQLELLPGRTPVRVRGIQSHGRSSERGTAGNRVAVNLGGIDHSAIERGMVLAAKGVFKPTQVIDAEIEVLKDASPPLRSRQRVRVHIGTAEILARVTVLNDAGEVDPGETGLVQLRLESPTAAVHGTRVILRSYSPQETIAGGRVLDPFATRHRRKGLANLRSYLSALADPYLTHHDLIFAFVTRSAKLGISQPELTARTGWLSNVVSEETRSLLDDSSIVEAGSQLFTTGSFEALRKRLLSAVKRHHEADPLSKGLSKESLRGELPSDVFGAVLNSLVSAGTISAAQDVVALAERKPDLSPAEATARNAILETLTNSGLAVPKIADLLDEVSRSSRLVPSVVRKILQTLVDSRDVVKVSNDFYLSRNILESLVEKLRGSATGERAIDVAKFKEISGVSRKYAIPLLEYFDAEKITIRTGDKRVIR